MNNQINKSRLESIEQIISAKIEKISSDKYRQELYDKGELEKIGSTAYNNYKDQLDRLTLNISASSLFMALIIGINAFIIYHFYYLDGIWIPCIIVIGYFFYLGRKRANEEKIKCQNHFKEFEKVELDYYHLLIKIKAEIKEINQSINGVE